MKTWVAIGVALALSFGCAMRAVDAADPYVVRVVLPLSGAASTLGSSESAALRALAATVNADGGVRGRPVQFDIEDDASDPETAAHLVNAAVTGGAPFVVGPALSATCDAAITIVAAAGTPLFCLAPTVAPPPGGFAFASAPSADDVQQTLFRYLASRKLVRVAVITSTDGSGADFDRRVGATLARPEFQHLTVVAHEHFAPADTSVDPQLARIAAAAPDVLLTFAVGRPFATLLRGIRDAQLNVPVYAAGGNLTYAQMQSDAPLLPNELILNGVRGIAADPAASGAQNRAQAVYANALAKAGLRSDYATAIAWDPMMIVLEAVKRAGTDAGAKQIEAALESLRGFTGIEGTYDFTTHDQRGLGAAAVALFRYDQAANAFVQVDPAKR
jgi:ABC-type branched-subunit amino acid transport system substrate-binding protein